MSDCQVPFPRWSEIASQQEMFNDLLGRGLDPDIARPIAESLSELLMVKAREEEANYEYLCQRITAVGGTSNISIKNATFSEEGRTNAGSSQWFLPTEAEVGDTVIYIITDENDETTVVDGGDTLPIKVDSGTTFVTYLTNTHTIAVWKLTVAEDNLSTGYVTFTSTEGHVGTQVLFDGAVSASVKFDNVAYDSNEEWPLSFTTSDAGSYGLLYFAGDYSQDMISFAIDDGVFQFSNTPNDHFVLFSKNGVGVAYTPTITTGTTSRDKGAALVEINPL